MRTLKRVKNDKPLDLNFHVKLPNVLRKKGVYTTEVKITSPDGSVTVERDKINLIVYPQMTRRRK